MDNANNSFTHSYRPGDIHFGRGCISKLGQVLDLFGCEKAMVFCGSNVQTNHELMDPIIDSLEGRLITVCPDSHPLKPAQVAIDGATHINNKDIDSIVAVGGGATMDLAKSASILVAEEPSLGDLQRILTTDNRVLAEYIPDQENKIPVFAVPTTLAGAALTYGAEINIDQKGDDLLSAFFFDEILMPTSIFYDPELFATTPEDILAGSIMNGFDKGIEILYSPHSSPITDGTAIRGLRLLSEAIPNLFSKSEADALDRAVAGILTAMQGLTMNPRSMLEFENSFLVKVSIIHAFGHVIREQFEVQQGVAHAVIVPHVLNYLLKKDVVRSDLLADALNVDNSPVAIVESIRELTDCLNMPTRLRDLSPPQPDLSRVAELVEIDPNMKHCPPGTDVTIDEIEDILEAAW